MEPLMDKSCATSQLKSNQKMIFDKETFFTYPVRKSKQDVE